MSVDVFMDVFESLYHVLVGMFCVNVSVLYP